MIQVRPFSGLYNVEHGRTQATRHFLSAGRSDVRWSRWGDLLAWDDDTIAPGSASVTQPHHDTEVITYVRRGVIVQKDNLGNRSRAEAGDFKIMSAGAGLMQSELNLGQDAAQVFRIWLRPVRADARQQSTTRSFPKHRLAGRLIVLASGFSEDAQALPIRAPARVLGASLKAGDQCSYHVEPERRIYLVPSTGRVDVNGAVVDARDGVAIQDTSMVTLRALDNSEILLVDVTEAE